jgi:hypothetical protein
MGKLHWSNVEQELAKGLQNFEESQRFKRFQCCVFPKPKDVREEQKRRDGLVAKAQVQIYKYFGFEFFIFCTGVLTRTTLWRLDVEKESERIKSWFSEQQMPPEFKSYSAACGNWCRSKNSMYQLTSVLHPINVYRSNS